MFIWNVNAILQKIDNNAWIFIWKSRYIYCDTDKFVLFIFLNTRIFLHDSYSILNIQLSERNVILNSNG